MNKILELKIYKIKLKEKNDIIIF